MSGFKKRSVALTKRAMRRNPSRLFLYRHRNGWEGFRGKEIFV